MRTAFTASCLYTPAEEIAHPLLVVEDGRITEVSSRSGKEVPGNASLVDFGDAVLAPAFLDIHMHGGAGLDLMRASASDLPRLGRFLTTHGVAGYFPTTVAAPLDATCAALERLADAIEADQTAAPANGESIQAQLLGIHLEGPFLSHKRRGVHPPAARRRGIGRCRAPPAPRGPGSRRRNGGRRGRPRHRRPGRGTRVLPL